MNELKGANQKKKNILRFQSITYRLTRVRARIIVSGRNKFISFFQLKKRSFNRRTHTDVTNSSTERLFVIDQHVRPIPHIYFPLIKFSDQPERELTLSPLLNSNACFLYKSEQRQQRRG